MTGKEEEKAHRLKPMLPGGGRLQAGATNSFVEGLEVEIGQIHVAVGQDVDGQDIFAFVEMHLEKLQRQIPVVPLAPGHGVGRIVG